MKKIAVIVGGAKSLGAYLAESLNKADYQIIILDIDDKNGKKIINKIGNNAKYYQCDATNEIDVENIFNQISKHWSRIDLLVYNAGYANANKITNFKLKEFNKSVAINLTGYFLTAKATAKIMIANNIEGVIININSKSGKIGSKHNSGYSAAKFGAVGLTQSLALDLAEYNIRVNSLMLGNLLDSDMFEQLIPQYAKKLNIKENEVKKYYIAQVPLKRGCSFEDVANILIFYASDKAKYCTGQSINITGGQLMF